MESSQVSVTSELRVAFKQPIRRLQYQNCQPYFQKQYSASHHFWRKKKNPSHYLVVGKGPGSLNGRSTCVQPELLRA